MTRRRFVQRVSIFSALSYNRIMGANSKIGVGFIGMGGRGTGLLKDCFLTNRDVEPMAVCDVYTPHHERAARLIQRQCGRLVPQFRDFRDLLERPDVDAVFIATPDHWHALMTIMACEAGKDIYVQKPISVDTNESRIMVEAVRKYGRICQVGTQQPSWNVFKNAITLVQSGVLGKILKVECFIHGIDLFPGPFNSPTMPQPPGLDWQMWLGPIPEPPFGPSDEFNPDIFGMEVNSNPDRPRSWYGQDIKNIRLGGTWRVVTRPFGGFQTDWGIHFTDIILRAVAPLLEKAGVMGPTAVMSSGGNNLYRDNRQLPDIQETVWEFPGFPCTFHLRTGNDYTYENSEDKAGRDHRIVFFGTEGTLLVNRASCIVKPNSGKKIEPIKNIPLEAKYDDRGDDTHVQNFFDCMRSRQDPIAPIEGGRHATDMCIAAQTAYWTGEKLDWDARTGMPATIAKINMARPYLRLTYRAPWKLEL